jgi:mannose-6-phosphate isomerase-like protein (cupin superfamily)
MNTENTLLQDVLHPDRAKNAVITDVGEYIQRLGLVVDEKNCDFSRPWGAFWRINEAQAHQFLSLFFPDIPIQEGLSVSPKFLLVEPNKRLSWQWHERRREEWYVVGGSIAFMRSPTDEMPSKAQIKLPGESVSLKQGERHRLIGLDTYGLVAEIWVHTDPSHPSDEADNHRVQDDFQRI